MADVVTDTYEKLFGGQTNLSMTERAVSVAIGLGLAAAAAKPRPNMWLNVLALVGGSLLALRGASGHCPVKAAMMGSDQGAHALESDRRASESFDFGPMPDRSPARSMGAHPA